MDNLASILVAVLIIGFFLWNYLRKEKKKEEKARPAAEKGKLYSEGPRSQHPQDLTNSASLEAKTAREAALALR